MNKHSEGLNDLIRKAAKDAQAGEARLLSMRHAAPAAVGGPWKLAAWGIVCVLATGWAILQLLALLMPVSQGQIRSDLVLAAHQARQEIEAARKRDGVLPAAIPNPALANLVNYEIKGTGYQLVVLTLTDRLEMDQAGVQVISQRKDSR